MNDRREFLRVACTGGICGCAGALVAAGPAGAVIGSAEGVQAQEDQLPRRWIAALVPALAAGVDREAARAALKSAAAAHWDQLGMTEKLAPYRGNLEGLVTFLTTQWGWKIERPEPGVIVADENKSYCVCPLVQKGATADLSALCYCSEGFAERLFGAVVGHPVHAEVTQSVRRGASSCRYRVSGV